MVVGKGERQSNALLKTLSAAIALIGYVTSCNRGGCAASDAASVEHDGVVTVVRNNDNFPDFNSCVSGGDCSLLCLNAADHAFGEGMQLVESCEVVSDADAGGSADAGDGSSDASTPVDAGANGRLMTIRLHVVALMSPFCGN